jgi:hypothetical protein
MFGLIALAVAGCSSHAGAAAQVDNQTISTATLSGIVDRGWSAYTAYAAANPSFIAQLQASGQAPLTRDTLQRQWLSTLVAERLAEVEARKFGVTVSDQEVNAYYQQVAVSQLGSVPTYLHEIAQLGVAPQDVPRIVRLDALQSKIEDKIAPDLIASDSEARSTYDALVTRFGTLPLTYVQLRPLLERNAQSVSDQRSAKLQPLLTQDSRQVGVSVSPRFGVWSPDDLAVLAQSGSVATVPMPAAQLNLSS